MNPLVSIIIPAYNKAKLTVKTVESALAQTYPNCEIIVVDDGSDDNTAGEMRKFADQIRFVRQENGGACRARNAGIRSASGEYLAFLDCDDLYLPEKIAKTVEYLTAHPQVGLVHTSAYFIDDHDNIVGEYDHRRSRRTGHINRILLGGNFMCNSTIVVRKQCLEDCGYFDETIFSPADWDLWLRISEKYEIGYLSEPLTKYRVTGNYIFQNVEKAREEELYVLNKCFERNNDIGPFYRKRLLSDLHLRYAQCYLLKENPNAVKREFVLSLRNNFLNPKTFGILVYYVFAKRSLTDVLKKKIIRHD